MKKYIRASNEKYELSYTIALEFEIVPTSSQFKAASTGISSHTPLPTYSEVLDFLANTAPTLIDGSKFVVEKSHGSDTESYYAKLSAIGPEGYIVTEPVARVRFASHINGDERKRVVKNPDVKNITDGYSSLTKGNRKIRLIRAVLKFNPSTLPKGVTLPTMADAKPKYVECNSLKDAPKAIRGLLDFAHNDLIRCKEICKFRTCTLSRVDDLWQIYTEDNRKIGPPCEFSLAIKSLSRKEIKNSTNFESDEAILDSIGSDIISKLSIRYPDIRFYLIDIYYIKDTLYFEYNSSIGYHECVALLNTDFSQLLDNRYYEQTITSIYNYICELFDADDDDSYLFED